MQGLLGLRLLLFASKQIVLSTQYICSGALLPLLMYVLPLYQVVNAL